MNRKDTKVERAMGSFPFVMTVRPLAWGMFILGLTIITLLVVFVVQKGMEHRDYMPIWGYIGSGAFFLYCYVVGFWILSKVR